MSYLVVLHLQSEAQLDARTPADRIDDGSWAERRRSRYGPETRQCCQARRGDTIYTIIAVEEAAVRGSSICDFKMEVRLSNGKTGLVTEITEMLSLRSVGEVFVRVTTNDS